MTGFTNFAVRAAEGEDVVSKNTTLGWLVRTTRPSGDIWYHGDHGTRSKKADGVPYFPSKRKAERKGERIKRKHGDWRVESVEVYRDPLNHGGEWTDFVLVEGEDRPVGLHPDTEIWVNSKFTVLKKPVVDEDPEHTRMCHLTIRHNDRHAVRDWRAFQRIKNELVGPECEAIELYPAESRLVDESNQYHLWCFVVPGVRFPVGYQEGRRVAGSEEAARHGAVQRDHE